MYSDNKLILQILSLVKQHGNWSVVISAGSRLCQLVRSLEQDSEGRSLACKHARRTHSIFKRAQEMVTEMVASDLARAQQHALLKTDGFDVAVGRES